MTTYTINETNEIVAFASPEEAAANSATPFDTFSNADELAQLATGWPPERLLAVWNGVPGLTPATEIKDAGKAARLIFKRLEKNGTKSREKTPKAEGEAKGGAPAAKGAPAKGKATKKATAAKNAPKAKTVAKAEEIAAPREERKARVSTIPIQPDRRRLIYLRGQFLRGSLPEHSRRICRVPQFRRSGLCRRYARNA